MMRSEAHDKWRDKVVGCGWGHTYVVAVTAQAGFAECVLVGSTTTISTIPITPSIVIFVVAICVAFPSCISARSFNFRHTLL